MIEHRKHKILDLCLLISTIVLLVAFWGCSDQKVVEYEQVPEVVNACTSENFPLEDYQSKLLDFSFDTASAIQVKPHIKDRSRAQEKLVHAALHLKQPKKAKSYIEQIQNWRRGAGYADLAFYCAQNEYMNDVQQLLRYAGNYINLAEDWRRDQIKSKIARTHALIGDNEKADEFEEGLVESETGKVAGVQAMKLDEDLFDQQFAQINELIKTENYDLIQNALWAYTELYGRFYEDQEKRSLVKDMIQASWSKMPIFVRIDLMIKLIDVAIMNEDQQGALILVKETQDYFEEFAWRTKDYIPRKAKIVKLKSKAGDINTAREDADALLALYVEEEDKIVNIYRAGVLRSVAEVYMMLEDETKALEIYKRAVEAGMDNPNSRPRAEDLSATTHSMALYNVKPDNAFWKRIKEIKQGLGDPW